MYDIANGNVELNYDVYLLTHHTFRAGLDASAVLINAKLYQNRIGVKIIDEAHLEFRYIIRIFHLMYSKTYI